MRPEVPATVVYSIPQTHQRDTPLPRDNRPTIYTRYILERESSILEVALGQHNKAVAGDTSSESCWYRPCDPRFSTRSVERGAGTGATRVHTRNVFVVVVVSYIADLKTSARSFHTPKLGGGVVRLLIGKTTPSRCREPCVSVCVVLSAVVHRISRTRCLLRGQSADGCT